MIGCTCRRVPDVNRRWAWRAGQPRLWQKQIMSFLTCMLRAHVTSCNLTSVSIQQKKTKQKKPTVLNKTQIRRRDLKLEQKWSKAWKERSIKHFMSDVQHNHTMSGLPRWLMTAFSSSLDARIEMNTGGWQRYLGSQTVDYVTENDHSWTDLVLGSIKDQDLIFHDGLLKQQYSLKNAWKRRSAVLVCIVFVPGQRGACDAELRQCNQCCLCATALHVPSHDLTLSVFLITCMQASTLCIVQNLTETGHLV